MSKVINLPPPSASQTLLKSPAKKKVHKPVDFGWTLWNRPGGSSAAVGLLGRAFPKLIIGPVAAQKMEALVALCRIEISWFGTSSRIGNNFRLDDVFVPPQVCSFGGTVFNEGDFFQMFMDDSGKIPTEVLSHFDKIRVWGHSHHTMAVNPSGTDEKQTTDFLGKFTDYFIRIICNKRGEIHVSIYDIDEGMVLHHPVLVHEKPTDGFRRDDPSYPFDEWAGNQIRLKVGRMPYEVMRAETEFTLPIKDILGDGFSFDQGDFDPADPDGDGSYYGHDWSQGYHKGDA